MVRAFFIAVIASILLLRGQAQCPVINGALINACAADGVTEGINEFVFFTTSTAGAASLYKFSYGSRNPPASQTPTGTLAGVDATTKAGPGNVFVQPGRTLHEVTTANTILPGGSRVVFIPYNLDQVYDFTNLCINNEVYVVYININAATAVASKWMAGGTMANAATSLRYLQMEFNGNACTSNVRSYDGSLWPNPGNTPQAEGNSLAWTGNDSTLYLNNGCSAIVTPVTLLSFNAIAAGGLVQLAWKTATEINSQYFNIERSANGRNFSSIGTVLAAGNSQNLRQYNFLDRANGQATIFYRLKMVDADGRFTYSPIARVNGQKSAPRLSVMQHDQLLSLQVNGTIAEKATITILDQTGRLAYSGLVQLTNASSALQVNTARLPAGVYVIQLNTASIQLVNRFVKTY